MQKVPNVNTKVNYNAFRSCKEDARRTMSKISKFSIVSGVIIKDSAPQESTTETRRRSIFLGSVAIEALHTPSHFQGSPQAGNKLNS